MTEAELLLPLHMAELEVFVVREVRICKERKFRLDFAERVTPVNRPRLGFEIEGIYYHASQGRSAHQSGEHYQQDCLKYALAQLAGFVVFRATPKQVLSGELREWIRLWLERQG